jgi:predicted TIM-barrel fold metal-dependent hydrolase
MIGAGPMCGCGASRRGFLAGALAATAAVGGTPTAAATARNIVDVHAHFMPPELLAAGGPSAVMGAWSLQKHLESMEQVGVTRSILSVTTPGVLATGAKAQALIRSCNEYGAKLVSDNRQKLGMFVYVRLDDIDATLKEIAYGMDVLKADGVGLFTNYDGKWLGDPAFDPVFAELNRRGAIAYVHPNSATCCKALIPNVADTLIEYGTDTTRAIASYIYRGAAVKFPRVRMIWSHSAGTMPYLIERFDGADKTPAVHAAAPEGFRKAASRFFYDVAQASNPVATSALRKVVGASQIVFGTDYPFRTPAEHVAQLESGGVFNAAELAGLYHGNVARGLPELLA